MLESSSDEDDDGHVLGVNKFEEALRREAAMHGHESAESSEEGSQEAMPESPVRSQAASRYGGGMPYNHRGRQ